MTNEVKERPILFSASMVRALLVETKTQTRRVRGLEAVNLEPNTWQWRDGRFERVTASSSDAVFPGECPYGRPGDRLWVKEAWAIRNVGRRVLIDHKSDELRPWYRERLQFTATDVAPATNEDGSPYWWNSRSSMFMPRWASRLTLEVTDVRVQRLQEISSYDATAEGVCENGILCEHSLSHRDMFQTLWESINGPESWEANPWVWAVSFKVVQP